MSILYKNDIKRILPLLQEMEEGKTLQIKTRNGWIDVDADKDGVNVDYPLNDGITVRIKQEPKFRPFKDAEECWNEMQKHQPFGWIKPKDDDVVNKFMLIDALRNEGIAVRTNIRFNYHELLEYYTFADRTPFGIIEEEQIWNR